MSNRRSIELAGLELRFPTVLPANLTDEHGTFLHLDQNLNLSGSPQGCRQHRIQVSVPKKMAGQHLWIEQGPGCPECVEVIEGPVHIPEGSRGKAPVDVLVDQDVRVGPGTFDMFKVRPMTPHDQKVLDEVNRLDERAWTQRQQLEDLKQQADMQARAETGHANKSASELSEASDRFLVAKYQKKGKKERQAELFPELKKRCGKVEKT